MSSKSDMGLAAKGVSSSQVNRVAGLLAGPAHYKVTIDADAKKASCTATACTFVHRGDTITFKNSTGDRVQLQFTNPYLFGKDRQELELGRGQSETWEVGPCARAGEYPFAVYCHAQMMFARGGSMPIIIVEPK
jgi:hypothetical protein